MSEHTLRLRVIRPFGAYSKGFIFEAAPSGVGQLWIERGFCELVEDAPKPKIIDQPGADKMIRRKATRKKVSQ